MARKIRLVDPLADLLAGSITKPGLRPAVLVGVTLDVEIRGGLVAVSDVRTFRNDRPGPIEAWLSFPVPASAVCYDLTATVNGRTFRSEVRKKPKARKAYEEAVAEGLGAVLYEEFLPGIHMVSVANLGPREEARVSIRWADSIRAEGSRARYRIPMTLGEVYGRSGLEDTDEPELGGPALDAELTLRHDARSITVDGASLKPVEDGGSTAVVPTDRPVDFVIEGWSEGRRLRGHTMGGLRVCLECKPLASEAGALDVAILVDTSGSMAGSVGGRQASRVSKHRAVQGALLALPSLIEYSDHLSLWQFSAGCEPLVSVRPSSQPYSAGLWRHGVETAWQDAVRSMSGPSGVTRVSIALASSARDGHRDVLLITDGLSDDLDIEEYVRSGHRLFVLLVGEDSLHGKVGRLALLTGGAVSIVMGSDLEPPVKELVRRMRGSRKSPQIKVQDTSGLPRWFGVSRDGMEVTSSRTEPGRPARPGGFGRAVGAFSAGIGFQVLWSVAPQSLEPVMPFVVGERSGPRVRLVPSPGAMTDRLQRIAKSEGLVTHLTSRVLVDDRGKQLDLPAESLKLRLATPRTGAGREDPQVMYSIEWAEDEWHGNWRYRTEIGDWLSAIARMVNWSAKSRELESGRLELLPLGFSVNLYLLAGIEMVRRFAEEVELDPTVAAIALVADSRADQSAPAKQLRDRLVRGRKARALQHFSREFCQRSREDIENLMPLRKA